MNVSEDDAAAVVGRRARRQVAGHVVLVAALMALAGCARSHAEPIGFGPSDVDSMELYVYPYGAEGPLARHVEVRDKREIAQWTAYFDYLPLEEGDPEWDALVGQEVAGFRFHLHDGGTFEISQVFIGKPVLIVEADGARSLSPYGSPFGDQLSGSTVVDVADAPEVQVR